MEIRNIYEEKSFNFNNNRKEKYIYTHLYKLQILILSLLFLTIINLVILIRSNFIKNTIERTQIKQVFIEKKEKPIQNKITNYVSKDLMPDYLSYEVLVIHIALVKILMNKMKLFRIRFSLQRHKN